MMGGGPACTPRLLHTPPQGASVNMVQDLPICKPYPPAEIDRLVAAKEVCVQCARTHTCLMLHGPRIIHCQLALRTHK